MQVYTVTVAETRERRMRLAAPSAERAIEAAKAVIRPRDRITDVRLWGERDRSAASEALAHLCSRDYLDLGIGVTPTVFDWIERAAMSFPALNGRLALAGVRVAEGRVFIGSPASVPALAGWFRGTPWAGSELLSVLMLVDDAVRTQCTFAGVRSRAVSLPLAAVMEASA